MYNTLPGWRHKVSGLNPFRLQLSSYLVILTITIVGVSCLTGIANNIISCPAKLLSFLHFQRSSVGRVNSSNPLSHILLLAERTHTNLWPDKIGTYWVAQSTKPPLSLWTVPHRAISSWPYQYRKHPAWVERTLCFLSICKHNSEWLGSRGSQQGSENVEK